MLVDHLDNSPVTAHQIQECTRKDPQLAQIVQFVQQGWPSTCPEPNTLAPFFEKRTQLSVYEGCLLWGTRVVIPTSCQDAVLTELHEGHPGVTRMKGLARMYVWWLGITKDIEQTIRLCSACQCTNPRLQLRHCTCGVGQLVLGLTRKDDTHPD